LNNQRFGARFVGEVANPTDILLFHRRKEPKPTGEMKKRKSLKTPIVPEEIERTNMEDLILSHLQSSEGELKILDKQKLCQALEGKDWLLPCSPVRRVPRYSCSRSALSSLHSMDFLFKSTLIKATTPQLESQRNTCSNRHRKSKYWLLHAIQQVANQFNLCLTSYVTSAFLPSLPSG